MQPTSPFHGRLQGGEQLLQVDDVRIAAKTSDEVGALLRGAPGSEVRLYVRQGPTLQLPAGAEQGVVEEGTGGRGRNQGRVESTESVEPPYTEAAIKEWPTYMAAGPPPDTPAAGRRLG